MVVLTKLGNVGLNPGGCDAVYRQGFGSQTSELNQKRQEPAVTASDY